MLLLSVLHVHVNCNPCIPDPRVQDWPLMATPGPILTIFLLYIVTVKQGPKLVESQKPIELSLLLVVYNFGLVALSVYMCYEVSNTG